MADSPAYRDTGGEAGVVPDRGSAPGTPRWVKVFATVAILAVLVVVGLMLLGGGQHGPGRHLGGDTPTGGAGVRTSPAGVPEDRPPPAGGHTPPAGGH